MESATAIIGVGMIVFLAHLFAVIFERLRIPDVLPLIGIGLILGPITNTVGGRDFGDVGRVFTVMALVIILFEGGLNLKLSVLKSSWYRASRLALFTFVASFATITLVGIGMVHLSVPEGLTLGAMLSATSPVLVLSMLSKMTVREELTTTLVVESSICEVLAIVSTLAFLKFADQHSVEPTVEIGRLIASLLLATIIGVVAALVWSSLLKLVRVIENSIFSTPAFVCIVYGVAEMLGYSGPVAVLAFGTVLGNIEQIKLPDTNIKWLQSERSGLTKSEHSFFSALVFLLKAFFFVYLGISIRFDSQFIVFVSLILSVWIFLARLIIVRFINSKSLTVRESALVSIMVPKGLATAVLASMLVTSSIPNALLIRETSYGVVLFSITMSAILTFLVEKNYLDKFFAYIFTTPPKGDAPPPPPSTPPPGEPAPAPAVE